MPIHEDAMSIPVIDIGDDGLLVQRTIHRDWLKDILGPKAPFQPTDQEQTSAGNIELSFTPIEGGYFARGRIGIEVQAQCVRCTEPAQLALSAPIEVTLFAEGTEPQADGEGELSEQAIGIATFSDQHIQLADLVRDEIFLEFPMTPLCSQECKGLCAQCGTNQNVSTCECKPAIDPRWAALRKIKLD